MANEQTETCANCGRMIGKLETPMVWQESVVCGACFEVLAASARKASQPAPDGAQKREPEHPHFTARGVPSWAVLAGVSVVVLVVFGIFFVGHSSAKLTAAEVKAYSAISAIGPWEPGQRSENEDCRRARAALAVLKAQDGGHSSKIEERLRLSEAFLQSARREASVAHKVASDYAQAAQAGRHGTRSESARVEARLNDDLVAAYSLVPQEAAKNSWGVLSASWVQPKLLAESRADWDRGLALLKRAGRGVGR